MNELMMFEGQHEVIILTRQDVTFDFKGDFLIRAKDVGSVLEYQGSSATQEVLKFVKPDQIFLVKNSDMVNRHIRKLNNAGEAFITNLALNRVLGKSEMPKASTFQDWLYEDILPSINKHGAYLTPEKVEEVLLNPDTIIKLATELKTERQKRFEAEQRVIEIAPKVAYLDTILQSKGTVTTSQIAKDYGLSATALNQILHEDKIQYLVNKQWVLYRQYDGKGYTQSYSFDFKHKDGTPDVKMNTRWTQRGRLFIHEILEKREIRANIDKDYSDAK